ncbi:MAG: hypothetical protein AAGI14_05490 [Pseudomonadota bacterium]
MALSSSNKPAFGKRAEPAVSATGISSKSKPLVEYTREKKRVRRTGPQSVFEVYWPFYVGFGLPVLISCYGFAYIVALSSGQPWSVLGLIFIPPIPLIMCFAWGAMITRALNGFNSAAQTTNSLFSWNQKTPGFQLGAIAGLIIFTVHQWPSLTAFIEDSFATWRAAHLILMALAYIGMTGVIFARIEAFVMRKMDIQVEKTPEQKEVETQIKTYRLDIPSYVPKLLSGLTIVGATGFLVASYFFEPLRDKVNVLNAIVVFPISYLILWFHFKWFTKLIQKSSRLFGYVAPY